MEQSSDMTILKEHNEMPFQITPSGQKPLGASEALGAYDEFLGKPEIQAKLGGMINVVFISDTIEHLPLRNITWTIELNFNNPAEIEDKLFHFFEHFLSRN